MNAGQFMLMNTMPHFINNFFLNQLQKPMLGFKKKKEEKRGKRRQGRRQFVRLIIMELL